ncbi:MAG: phosphodiester glycosidase family protein [Clostridia bacterium]|nr:phosphodiester glycosidase family protein [Clostridia bacterium]
MKKIRSFRLPAIALALVMLFCLVQKPVTVRGMEGLKDKDWVTEYSEHEIYPGVMAYDFVSTESSKYKLNHIHIVEFDPAQSDLYVEVTNESQYSNTLKTVQKTMEEFNANNPGKTALAGVNGDMWMVSYAHARILGREDLLSGSYKSYAGDPVVTQSLTIPRGFNVYKGEIISSPHDSTETPYEGEFQAFGVSADGVAQLGQPKVTVNVTNNTTGKTEKMNGINRLPSNKAVMMYTDKGPVSNYSLEDAFEIIIDFDEDYVIRHGTNITGTVVGICGPGDENMPMKENRIIITARGEKKIAKFSDYSVGDKITIEVTVKDTFKNDEFWQNVYTAVGGHMVFARDGKASGLSGEGGYPTTIIATNKAGKMLFIQADGRQTGFSVGIPFTVYGDLAKELDLEDAFIVDGGGSSTMVQLAAEGYKLVNRPSDKKSDGTYGSPRTVVNSVIVASGPDRNAPPATEVPTEEPAAPATEEAVPATDDPGKDKDDSKKSGLGTGAIIGIIAGCVALAAVIAFVIIKAVSSKKKK